MNHADPQFAERFLKRVRMNLSGCWLWVGSCDREGYGQFHGASTLRTSGSGTNRANHQPRLMRAHRYSFEVFTGQVIPDKMTVDHKCFVRNCVNPDHLELVSDTQPAAQARARLAELRAAGAKLGREFRTVEANLPTYTGKKAAK